MQIPSDIADLLTKWVQERVTTMPDKDLQHLVPKFEQAGITKTKQLSAMSKQERNTLFRELGVNTVDKVTLLCTCQQLDNASNFGLQKSVALPASPICCTPTLRRDSGSYWSTRGWTSSTPSKRYVGIFNQGATCYLNSLLQALFYITEFRKAVYSITIDDQEDARRSIPLALQRLFYDLEFSQTPASTKALTASFGWTQEDSFVQHDVQELLRKLSDNLGAKMEGTPAEGSVSRLFCGKMLSYVRCLGLDHTSLRVEDFYDLQLSVRGCKDVYSSFREYTAVEVLNGKNKYAVDQAGKMEYVDAEKGVWFETMPPVIILHLRRFEYNVNTDSMGKVHDFYEYYEEIDVKDLLVPANVPWRTGLGPHPEPPACNGGHSDSFHNGSRDASPAPTPTSSSSSFHDAGQDREDKCRAVHDWDTKYVLYSVLVHSGGAFGGHYYAYVRPNNGDQWVKFNDSVVTEVQKREVLQANFGQKEAVATSTTAYMLIYMRQSCVEHLVYELPEALQPHHLKDHIVKERSAAEADRKQKEEEKRKVLVRVWTEEAIRKWNQANPLTAWDRTDFEDAFLVAKDAPFQELLFQVEQHHRIPAVRQRLWLLASPVTYIQRRPEGKVRDLLLLSRTNDQLERVQLFAQSRDGDEAELRHRLAAEAEVAARDELDPDPQCTLERRFPFSLFSSAARAQAATLLFVNYFDAKSQDVTFCGAHTFLPQTPVGKLFQLVCGIAKLPKEAPLRLLVLTPGGGYQALGAGDLLGQAKVANGDIAWVQQWAPAPANGKGPAQPAPAVKRFLDELRQRRLVTFVRHDCAARYWQTAAKRLEGVAVTPLDPGAVVNVTLQLSDTYSAIQAKLAAALLSPNPAMLRLWAGNTLESVGRPGPYPKPEPVRDALGKEATLATISGQALSGGRGATTLVLYWDEVELPVAQYEMSAVLSVAGYNAAAAEVASCTVRVAKDLPLERLLERLSEEFRAAPLAAGAAPVEGPAAEAAEGAEDPRRCLWEPKLCWLVAVKGGQVQMVFGHDCTKEVIVPKLGITASNVLEEASKMSQLRFEPRPCLRLSPLGRPLPAQRWTQVVHFECLGDGLSAPSSPVVRGAPFARPLGDAEKRIRLHSTPFLMYVSAEDTGASLLRCIEQEMRVAVPAEPPWAASSDSLSSDADSDARCSTPEAKPRTPGLYALEHVREAVWRVRPIRPGDTVLAKLQGGKKSCLGWQHPAPDGAGPGGRPAAPRVSPKRCVSGGAGPELKILN